MESLSEISKRYKTDKGEHTHYLDNYERYFGQLRKQPIKVLELGIRDGGSLLMWRDYFPQGQIAGLDIFPAAVDDRTGRVHMYIGEQQDALLLDKIAGERAPGGFDIIIDDCSHIGTLARASFKHLFHNHLKSGGTYVIEDWGCGYWDHWPDGTRYTQRDSRSSAGIRERIGYKIASVIRRPAPRALANVLSVVKTMLVAQNSTSHNAGMVGFVKELLDECALADVHRGLGTSETARSAISEIHIFASHAFVIKA